MHVTNKRIYTILRKTFFHKLDIAEEYYYKVTKKTKISTHIPIVMVKLKSPFKWEIQTSPLISH